MISKQQTSTPLLMFLVLSLTFLMCALYIEKTALKLLNKYWYSMDAIFCGGNFHAVSQEICSLCVVGNNPIIAIKYAHLGEFNGKNAGTTTRSIILVYPDIE